MLSRCLLAHLYKPGFGRLQKLGVHFSCPSGGSHRFQSISGAPDSWKLLFWFRVALLCGGWNCGCGRCLCLPFCRAPRGHINRRILHSGSKVRYQRASRNHGLEDPYLYVAPFGLAYRCTLLLHTSTSARGDCTKTDGLLSQETWRRIHRAQFYPQPHPPAPGCSGQIWGIACMWLGSLKLYDMSRLRCVIGRVRKPATLS